MRILVIETQDFLPAVINSPLASNRLAERDSLDEVVEPMCFKNCPIDTWRIEQILQRRITWMFNGVDLVAPGMTSIGIRERIAACIDVHNVVKRFAACQTANKIRTTYRKQMWIRRPGSVDRQGRNLCQSRRITGETSPKRVPGQENLSIWILSFDRVCQLDCIQILLRSKDGICDVRNPVSETLFAPTK